MVSQYSRWLTYSTKRIHQSNYILNPETVYFWLQDVTSTLTVNNLPAHKIKTGGEKSGSSENWQIENYDIEFDLHRKDEKIH